MTNASQNSSSSRVRELLPTSSCTSSTPAVIDEVKPSIEAQSSNDALSVSANPTPKQYQSPWATDSFQLRFLDFPELVRFEIYELLLLVRKRGEHDTNFAIASERVGRLHLHPEILRTSRQVHDEAASVLYGKNIFEADTSEGLGPFQYKWEDLVRWTPGYEKTLHIPARYVRLMKRVTIHPIALWHGYSKLKDIQKLVEEGRKTAKMVAKRLKHVRLRDLTIYCTAPSELYHPDGKDWPRKILNAYGGNPYFWVDETIEPLTRLKHVRNLEFYREPSLEMRVRFEKLSQIPDHVEEDSANDSCDSDGNSIQEPGRGYSWERDSSDDEGAEENDGGDAGEVEAGDETEEDDESEEGNGSEDDDESEHGEESLEADEADETDDDSAIDVDEGPDADEDSLED